MAQSHRIVIDQGADYRLPLRWWTDSTKTQLRDLTGYTARMQARRRHSDADTTLSITEPVNIVLGDGTGAENVTVVLTAAQTAALPAPFRGVYDLELVDTGGTGEVTRLIEGEFVVNPEVTR